MPTAAVSIVEKSTTDPVFLGSPGASAPPVSLRLVDKDMPMLMVETPGATGAVLAVGMPSRVHYWLATAPVGPVSIVLTASHPSLVVEAPPVVFGPRDFDVPAEAWVTYAGDLLRHFFSSSLPHVLRPSCSSRVAHWAVLACSR